MPRGRPRGKVKVRVPSEVIDEWATIWDSGDTGKALVLNRIEALDVEKDVILSRMANASEKRRDPALNRLAEIEVGKILNVLQPQIENDANFRRLSKITPKDNLVVNLHTLAIERVRRPTPRAKVRKNVKSDTKHRR